MVYRNNAGRPGAGFISVCLETRWLGQNRGFGRAASGAPEPLRATRSTSEPVQTVAGKDLFFFDGRVFS